MRGYAYSQTKNQLKAIQEYTAAIKLEPQTIDNYWNRGVAEAALQRDDEALHDFTEVISRDNSSLGAYVRRGEIFSKRGEHQRAIAEYTKSLRIDPNYRYAISHLKEELKMTGSCRF